MDATTIDIIKAVAPYAIIVLQVIISPYFVYRAAKLKLDIERIRLHEKDKLEAYKRLFKFAHDLRNNTFPLADGKRPAFISLMQSHYVGKLQLDFIYFPDDIAKILDTLEEHFICMTRVELVPEMDLKDEEEFVERELSKLADLLANHVKKAISAKRITV